MSNVCNEKIIINKADGVGGDEIEKSCINNFRDVSEGLSKIKIGFLYRTSSITSYQKENAALNQLKSNGIKTIIDLRAEREIETNPYSELFLSGYEYSSIPLDPWNQPEWFIEETNTIYSVLSNAEKAYYYFIKCCQNQIRAVFEVISESNNSIAIHCVAGKDRTGLVVILVGMLLSSSYEELLADYLDSKQDTDESKFHIFYDYVISKGGIEAYLFHCGINSNTISCLKLKLAK